MNSQYAEHLDYIFRFDFGTPALGLFGHSTLSEPFLQDAASCEAMPLDVLAARLQGAFDRSMAAKKQGNPKQSIVEARWVARTLSESLATAFGATMYALYHPSYQKKAWSWLTQTETILQSLARWSTHAQVICAHHSRLSFRSMKLLDVVLLAIGLCQLAMNRLSENQPNQIEEAQLLHWLWPPETAQILSAFFVDLWFLVVCELAQRILSTVPAVEEQNFSAIVRHLPRHFFGRLVVMTRLHRTGSMVPVWYRESPPGTLAVIHDIVMNHYLTAVLEDQLAIFDQSLTQLLLSDQPAFVAGIVHWMDAIALFLQHTFLVDKNVPYLTASIVAYLLSKKETSQLALFFTKCPIAPLYDLLAKTQSLLADHDLVTTHLLFFSSHLATRDAQGREDFFFQYIHWEFWQSLFQASATLATLFWQYLTTQGPAIFAQINHQVEWLTDEGTRQTTSHFQLSQQWIRVCIPVLGWILLLESFHQTKTLSAFFPMQSNFFSLLRLLKKKYTSVDIDKMITLPELTIFASWISTVQHMEWMDALYAEIQIREQYVTWLRTQVGLTSLIQKSTHKVAIWLRTVLSSLPQTDRWFDRHQFQGLQNLLSTDLAAYTTSFVLQDGPVFFCHIFCAALLHFSSPVMTNLIGAVEDALLDDFVQYLQNEGSRDEISLMLRFLAEKPGDAYREMSHPSSTFWQTLRTQSHTVLAVINQERAQRALAGLESMRERVAHWVQQCIPAESLSSTLTLTWDMLAVLRDLVDQKNRFLKTDPVVHGPWLPALEIICEPLIHFDASSFVRVAYEENDYECAILFQKMFVDLGMHPLATFCEPFVQQMLNTADYVPFQHVVHLLLGLQKDDVRQFLEHFYSFTKEAHHFNVTGPETTGQNTNQIRKSVFLIRKIIHRCDVALLKQALMMVRNEKYVTIRAYISFYADQLWSKDRQKSNSMHLLSGVMWSLLDRSLAQQFLKEPRVDQYGNTLLLQRLDRTTRAVLFEIFDIAVEDIDHTRIESQGLPLKFRRRLKC